MTTKMTNQTQQTEMKNLQQIYLDAERLLEELFGDLDAKMDAKMDYDFFGRAWDRDEEEEDEWKY